VDVAFITCSLPDENGYCSFGISADIAVSAAEVARDVIALVSPNIPYLYGDCLIHESKISAAVLCDVAPFAMTFGEPTPIEAAIGANVASQIPDGACLQIGVGGIPNAVLNGIKHHQHLGLHTEAMTDGVIRLMKEGVIDNSLKKVKPGISVAALAIGSKEMYGYIDHNKTMEFFDVAYTNDPFLIAQNPRACAINSAIEVDLTGQICADSIGDTIFSSVGGQHDFMYGCSLSEGGRTFIALPSRTAKGKAKIVAHLAPGAGVVTTRFQTQYVATEYGIVYLRGKSLAERAKLLISIAHPEDREELEKAACERFGYSFLRIKS
jgi:acyl-CoA hydrolase